MFQHVLYNIVYDYLGVGYQNGELAYLIQFKDANEPGIVKHFASRIWASLVFDFLVEKIKYEGFEPDPDNSAIKMLSKTAIVNGTPDIVCVYQCIWMQHYFSYSIILLLFNYLFLLQLFADVTNLLGGLHFCLKYTDGYKFEEASIVKKNFAKLAVAYLEENLKTD